MLSHSVNTSLRSPKKTAIAPLIQTKDQKHKNGTIKTFAGSIKFQNGNATEQSSQLVPPTQNIVNFDHMAYILKAKKVKPGAIFLIDDDIDALIELIALIEKEDTESVKIGVLFRVNGHTTPFCIEKIVPDIDISDDEGLFEQMAVYHTDSVVMDIDQEDMIKEIVNRMSKLVPIYSLGYDDPNQEILRDFKRQSDGDSCALYSLFDIEQIFEMNFHQFARENSDRTSHNLFTLKKLPPVFMATIQSVKGSKEEGLVRNGLEYYIENNQNEATKEFIVNDEKTSLKKIYGELLEVGIGNPIIAIMNQYNYEAYQNTLIQQEREPTEFTLTKQHFENANSKKILTDQIYDCAVEQFERRPSEEEKPKSANNNIAVTTLVVTIIGLIVIGLIQYQIRNKQSQVKKSSTDEDNTTAKQNENGSNIPLIKKRFPRFGEDPVPQTSVEEMVKSQFGQASFTAKLIRKRLQAASEAKTSDLINF